MFTVEQISAAHAKVKSGADFPDYIKALKQLGVIRYETYVSDGHTTFYGLQDYKINSDPKYAVKSISLKSNKQAFESDLKRHQQGRTDYPTFCDDCAKAGVNKWEVDLEKMTCTYYDNTQHEMLKEAIPG